MTVDARPLVTHVYFSVRTRDDATTLAELARRVNRLLNVRMVPEDSPRYERRVMTTRVLGLEISLASAQSLERYAPRRFQLSARQPFGDRGYVHQGTHHIDGWLLRVLERHEPGRWYRPSPFEGLIDTGLESWKVQGVWDAVRRVRLEGLPQAPEKP
jgi:hypothetical protein